MTKRHRPALGVLLGRLMAALLFLALSAAGQQQPDPATAAQDPSGSSEKKSPDPQDPKAQDNSKAQDKQDKGKTEPSGTSNDRLFYTLPNFLTVQNAGTLPPLTTWQKFKVVARGSFDYVEYPWYAALAGVSQAENSEPGYGQGAAGYGKRYGAAFADGTIENFMTGAVLPSLLRQDPRFYQLPEGTFWHRTGYAISRIFVTRTDSGHEQFNFSEIFGAALSAGISTYSYHPRSDRNVGNAASVWGTQIGLDTITIVVKEFWPDIRGKIQKKRHPEANNP